jgi:hypothetical protein
MSRFPPIRPIPAAALAASASVTIAAGCGATPPPIDGLLVATGGPIRITGASGSLVAFDGPPDPIAAVSGSRDRVVAATGSLTFMMSDLSSGERIWTAIDVPRAGAMMPPLMALSPLGNELALARGDLQGSTFDLVFLDLASGASRSVAIPRGLNGAPAWIGPGVIAIDVMKPTGESGIAAIDARSGAVTDDVLIGATVSATSDGRLLAVDDPATGDVSIGALDRNAPGQLVDVVRLSGPPGSSVEGLALGATGVRLAVVRRSETGLASVEIYRRVEAVWTNAHTIDVASDGPVSVAWLG